MAQRDRTYLKAKFETGATPTQEDFHDWLDSVPLFSENELSVVFTVENQTGGSLAKGTVIYPDPVTVIGKADAYRKEKSRLIAVLDEDLLDEGIGTAVKLGVVSGLDTSAFSTPGQIAYLGQNGLLAANPPTDGGYAIIVGVIDIVDAVNGQITVDPSSTELTVEVTDTNGFPPDEKDNTILSYVNATRTFTVGASSYPYHYYVLGEKYEQMVAQSIQWSDQEGFHWIYFDENGIQTIFNPTAAQKEEILVKKCITSYFYWNAVDKKVEFDILEERHGISMSPATHVYLHRTRGSQFLEGFGLSDFVVGAGSSNTHAQYSVAAGAFADEDITNRLESNLPVGTTIPVAYLLGASNFIRLGEQSGFAVLNAPAGRLYYNQFTGGAWQLTQVGNGNFVLYHVFAINGVNTNKQVIVVMGQAEYATSSEARAAASTEISTIVGTFEAEEGIPLGTIIYETKDTFTNSVKARVITTESGGNYVDWRTTELAEGVSPSNHQNLSGLETGSTAAAFGHFNPALYNELKASGQGKWKWNTSTTIADPGAGFILMNAGFTQIAINYTDAFGANLKRVISSLGIGGTLLLRISETKWKVLEITAILTDNTTWGVFTCVVANSGGIFLLNEVNHISFYGVGGGAAPILYWQYNNSTSDVDPGAGKFLIGSGFINISTSVFSNEAGVGNVLSNIKNGGTIYLQNKDDNQYYKSINVIGDAVNQSTYYKIPISIVDENNDLVLDQVCGFTFLQVAATQSSQVPSNTELTFDNPNGKFYGDLDLSTGDKSLTIASSGNKLGFWVSFNIIADGTHKFTLDGARWSNILGAQINIPGDGILPAGEYLIISYYTPDGATLAIPGNVASGDVPPIISSSLIANDNSYIDITMSEGVYANSGATDPLVVGDFSLIFTQGSGTATNVTISGLSKQNGLPLVGGESIIRLNLSVTGTANGQESIEITPFDGSSIFNSNGVAMQSSQTTGSVNLKDRTSPNPVYVSGVTNNQGTQIELTFDKAMADPTGQQAAFAFDFGGNAITAGAVALKGGDNTTFVFSNLSATIQQDWGQGQVDYTPGTIQDSLGNPLGALTDEIVINDVQPSVLSVLTWPVIDVNLSTANDGLIKDASAGYGTLARSAEAISDGQSVQAGVSTTGGSRVFGLTKETNFVTRFDFDFGLLAQVDNQLLSWERGALTVIGTYVDNDFLRVRIDGTAVRYEKSSDGGDTWSTVATSSNTANGGYYVGVDINEVGSTLINMNKAKTATPTLQVSQAITNSVGDRIELRMNLPIADPTGQHAQFTFDFGGNTVNPGAAAKKDGDDFVIELTSLSQNVNSAWGDGTFDYTPGTIESVDGEVLASISGQLAENNVVSGGATVTFLEIDANLTQKKNGVELTSGAGWGQTFRSNEQITLGGTVQAILNNTKTSKFLGITQQSMTGGDWKRLSYGFYLQNDNAGRLDIFLSEGSSLGSSKGKLNGNETIRLAIDGAGNVSIESSTDDGATWNTIFTSPNVASGNYEIAGDYLNIGSAHYDIITY